MSLYSLLQAVRPLLKSPEENSRKLSRLLERNKGLAEYEVARALVDQALRPVLDAG